MSVTRPIRLAAIATHPVQYFAPVFRLLETNEAVEFLAIFASAQGAQATIDPFFGVEVAWDSAPLSGYRSTVLDHGGISVARGLKGIILGVRAALQARKWGADYVLIFNYSPAFITAATVTLWFSRCKLLLRAETADHTKVRSWLKARLRDGLLTRYYRRFERVFPIGIRSDAHYARLSVPLQRRDVVRYAPDTAFLALERAKWLPQRAALRETAGIGSDDVVLLFVGKLYGEKRIDLITAAIGRMTHEQRRGVWLVVAGDGPDAAELKREASELLGDKFVFKGFVNQRALGEVFAIGDVLLLPSRSETWGLVVNEALFYGLGVVVSDTTGVSAELRRVAQARVFEGGSETAFADAIRRAVADAHTGTREQIELGSPSEFVHRVLEYVYRAN